MSIAIGQQLKIRSMIYVAAEPVPFFWPMRAFIHHNPLHGLEGMPFETAVVKGSHLFHGQAFLPRALYQEYLHKGSVDRERLQQEITDFLQDQESPATIPMPAILERLLTREKDPVILPTALIDDSDVQAASATGDIQIDSSLERIAGRLREDFLGGRPIYEVVDALHGTDIGASLDELVIKSCLDFFDEGQSVWHMPNRELGFFAAWRQVAQRNIRFFLRGLHIKEILDIDESPEGIIAYVMQTLQIPEEHWVDYFTRELARLHGWAGFIRWRSSASNYYWEQRYPGDLVDYMAVRMLLALTLLRKRSSGRLPIDLPRLTDFIRFDPYQAFLRNEFYGGGLLVQMAHQVEDALLRKDKSRIALVYTEYCRRKRQFEAERQAAGLLQVAQSMGVREALRQASHEQLQALLQSLRAFQAGEGMVWLKAMEASAAAELL
ncbi:MAG: Na-translocating system protein MpsB, partial [Gammaproteobacteria bacterium]